MPELSKFYLCYNLKTMYHLSSTLHLLVGFYHSESQYNTLQSVTAVQQHGSASSGCALSIQAVSQLSSDLFQAPLL